MKYVTKRKYQVQMKQSSFTETEVFHMHTCTNNTGKTRSHLFHNESPCGLTLLGNVPQGRDCFVSANRATAIRWHVVWQVLIN